MSTAPCGTGSPDRSEASLLPGSPVTTDNALPLRFRSHSKFALLVLLVIGSVAYRSQFSLSSASVAGLRSGSGLTSSSTSPSPLLSKLFTTLTLTSTSFGNSSAGSPPSFLVAGVHKGGSTAIFGYLTRIWKKGLDYYLRHFPDLSKLPHVITGEGTPNYIRDPYAPARIRQMFPKVKLVVSFRDPVERFISHFVGQIVNAKLRKQTPVKDCNAYIRKNMDAISRCLRDSKSTPFHAPSPFNYNSSANTVTTTLSSSIKPPPSSNKAQLTVGLPRGECLLNNHTACLQHRCASLRYEAAISRSIYVDQLERWLMFYPPEQLHIVQAERLFQGTAGTMQKVARFLGLREYTSKEVESFASTHRGSSHMADPISGRCDRKALTAFFKPFNERFYALLQKNWPQVAKAWQPWPE